MLQWKKLADTGPPPFYQPVLIFAEDVVVEARYLPSGEWEPVVLGYHGCGCCGDAPPVPEYWAELNKPVDVDLHVKSVVTVLKPDMRRASRVIFSSDRLVHTREFANEFWVFHKSTGTGFSGSGPFPLDDPRFSSPTYDHAE